MDLRTIAQQVNTLAAFCGPRDIPQLSTKSLQEKYGFSQVDVMVLFGGTILEGVFTLQKAMEQRLAQKYLIVGGYGHTTEALRAQLQKVYPKIDPTLSSEAELLAAYLQQISGKTVDYLETHSTNCGNNITNLLALLQEKQIDCQSIILCQDATMQKRMAATLEKHVQQQMTIINYAAYETTVIAKKGQLVYTETPRGMWSIERYLNLLMGEIPRLTNDTHGYGPKGADYLAEVFIPPKVQQAFESLEKAYPQQVRQADPRFK